MTLLKKGKNILQRLTGSSYLLEINKLSEQFKDVIIILDNNHQIDALYTELKSVYKNKNVIKFPDYGLGSYDNTQIDKTIIKDRFTCLIDLYNETSRRIVITTYKAIFYKIPALNEISNSWKNISKQSSYDEILATLKSYGYQKTSKIEEPGQYRVSGSIIDCFSLISNEPIRINFFGDQIETIKSFDPLTQISFNEIDDTMVCVNGLYKLDQSNIDNYVNMIKDYFDDEYLEDIEYERIVLDKNNLYIHNLIPKLFNPTQSILTLFNREVGFFIQKDPFSELNDHYEYLCNIYENEKINRYLIRPDELLIEKDDLEKIVKNNYLYISSDSIDDEVKRHSGYSTIPNISINYNYKNPYTNFENFFSNSQYKYIFFIKRNDNYKTFTNYLKSRNISYDDIDSINSVKGIVHIFRQDINEGFVDNNSKTVYVSSNDLFGLIKTRITSKETIKSSVIDSLTDLKINDYVVHQDHGIGKYKGLMIMDIENKKTELIKIEYAENNNLYMPVTSMTLIQKYIGNTGLNTKLSQLGSDKWQKIKQRAKKKIEDIAVELLSVQAKRELSQGYKFDLNNLDYEKFCSLFPYVETDDQLDSINDVISDMCSARPMDRVICGDVGFGKTEVILRAAFIASNNSKQVVVIVPTTVLAKQHYQTFKRRFSQYAYNIGIITRALTKKEKIKTLQEINSGKTNIIIGTHSLLSKDYKYADLGLLIIDEEHKFGVKHKESIKQIKENVDVLTLTATPIPRTLNSALSEIKDMSVINTPPIGRKNIETSIIEKSIEKITMFINREISRGGQLLYIHNNIDTMIDEINFLTSLNQDITINRVHGRLSNQEIESVMNDFIDEKINVLVCTSIIESGLDMTNVNTIIINNAENFGLSQLHQLRGRVGRSNKQAYAGLLLSNKGKLTREAERRIDAFIKTNSLAGGIEIAGHDLDIRGAGEILGEEQSGQIFEIGYGMYTTMLSRAISQIKNKKETIDNIHTEIDSYISTLIPQDYVDDIFLRLEIYNEIANSKNDYDIDKIASKLEDIYGPIPDYLSNLLNLTRVRISADNINAESIKINKESTIITLNAKSLINHEKLINNYVMKDKIKISDEFNLRYKNKFIDDFPKICEEIIILLTEILN